MLKYQKYIYISDTKYFKNDDVDIDKIKVSDKKLHRKEHNSYIMCFMNMMMTNTFL